MFVCRHAQASQESGSTSCISASSQLQTDMCHGTSGRPNYQDGDETKIEKIAEEEKRKRERKKERKIENNNNKETNKKQNKNEREKRKPSVKVVSIHSLR